MEDPITRFAMEAMAKKKAQLENLKEPTVADMVVNFAAALKGWAACGFKTVTKEKFDERLSKCRACSLWDEQARFGAGKCNHKKCGCTKLKPWLESSNCPKGEW